MFVEGVIDFAPGDDSPIRRRAIYNRKSLGVLITHGSITHHLEVLRVRTITY